MTLVPINNTRAMPAVTAHPKGRRGMRFTPNNEDGDLDPQHRDRHERVFERLLRLRAEVPRVQ